MKWKMDVEIARDISRERRGGQSNEQLMGELSLQRKMLTFEMHLS